MNSQMNHSFVLTSQTGLQKGLKLIPTESFPVVSHIEFTFNLFYKTKHGNVFYPLAAMKWIFIMHATCERRYYRHIQNSIKENRPEPGPF